MQILKIKNIWRNEHDLPLLPEIKKKEIQKLSDDVINPLISKLENAKTDAEIDEAIAEIEKYGLSALQPMMKYYDEIDDKHPAKEILLAMLKRISIIVNEIRFAKDSEKPNVELGKTINALEGKQLSGELIVEVIKKYLDVQPAISEGIRISACRDNDLMGWTVIIDIPKISGKLKNYWEIDNYTKINNVLQDSKGGYTYGYLKAISDKTYTDFIKGVKKAKEASPHKTISIEISVIQQLDN